MNSYIPMRGNPQRHTSEKKTVEELYFHTGNSGITARVLETKKLPQDRSYVEHVSYRLEFVHGAHGHSSTMSTPLLSPSMVDQYIDMLQRLKTRMMLEDGYVAERHFEDDRVVQVMDGYRIDAVYTPRIVTGPNSTSVYLLGHTYSKDGEEAIFRRYRGKKKEVGDCGESPACGPDRFRPEHIGRVYSELQAELDPLAKVIPERRMFKVEVSDLTEQKAMEAIEEVIAEITHRKKRVP